MGSVNFSGAGTGIDWSVIIEADIQARTRQVITPLNKWKDSWETKLDTYDRLRTYLSALRTAVKDMDTPEELRAYAVQSSSETTVAAQLSGRPTPGAYSLQVNQLAQAELEIHAGVDSDQTVVNNSGGAFYFSYTYAGQTATVEVADGMTLSELAALINNDSGNPGVTASVLDDGTAGTASHHLVLRGTDTGASYAIAVNAAGTTLQGEWAVLTADAPSGSSSLTVDDASAFRQYQAILVADGDSAAEYHVIDSIAANTLALKDALGSDFTTAQSAYVTPRGIGSGLAAAADGGASQVTVEDASHFQVGKSVIIAGAGGCEELTISAVDTTAGTITFSTALTAGYSADAYVTQLEGGRRFTFQDTDFSEVQAAQNAQVRLNGYPPAGWIERADNVVADLIPGITLTLQGTTGGMPLTITVTTDAAGVKEKIQAFVDAYNTVKTFLNQQTSYNADSGQAGKLLGSYAASVVESLLTDIIISAPPGFQDGTDAYTLLGQVGLATVGLTDDETSLGTITVDEEALDEALAEDFEALMRLFSASFRGYSNSDYLTFGQASSLMTTPGTYDVEADFDGSGNLIAGRIKLSTESTFRSATVDGSYLVGTAGNPESSLSVRAVWDGSSTTQTATVRLTQGVAGRLTEVLDDVLDSTGGLLHTIDASYRDIVSQIDARIEQEQARLEQLRDRLTAKYARLEQLLVELQGQESWATSLAESLS
jgi:flagellar capping protein FliD